MAERAWEGLRLGGQAGREKVGLGYRAGAVLALNLLDGMFTVAYLQLGVAEEANPLMRLCYQSSPLAFMAVKLFAVQLGVLLLWRYRASPLARQALGLAAGLYAGIVLWHLALLAHLAGG